MSTDAAPSALGTETRLVAISRWVNAGLAGRDPEAIDLHRTMKVVEETGEVFRAITGWTNANPRKGRTHTREDVIDELLDVASAALAAVEHMTGHAGDSLNRLDEKVRQVAVRAGLEPEHEETP